jgi:CDP-diacylglycerol---serine O-phosphatidyltransferase
MQSTIVRRLRESGKRRLVMIPFLFTFANAFFGLLSVLYALEDSYILAAYCIFAAAFVDGLDGRIARALGTTSTLGMELDSLCDAISFCFAPAILLYSFYFYEFDICGPIAAGIYLCAGLFRLARFNMISSANKQCFIGLPTPVAALFFALCIINDEWLLTSCWQQLFYSSIALMVLVAGLSFLMVSRIEFPSFKAGIAHRLSRIVLVVTMLAAGMAVWCGSPLLLTVLVAYILTAVLCHGGSWWRKQGLRQRPARLRVLFKKWQK